MSSRDGRSMHSVSFTLHELTWRRLEACAGCCIIRQAPSASSNIASSPPSSGASSVPAGWHAATPPRHTMPASLPGVLGGFLWPLDTACRSDPLRAERRIPRRRRRAGWRGWHRSALLLAGENEDAGAEVEEGEVDPGEAEHHSPFIGDTEAVQRRNGEVWPFPFLFLCSLRVEVHLHVLLHS
jgi:hypothetical protein